MQATQPARGYPSKSTYYQRDYHYQPTYPKSHPRHYEESGYYRGSNRQNYYQDEYEQYPPKREAVTEEY